MYPRAPIPPEALREVASRDSPSPPHQHLAGGHMSSSHMFQGSWRKAQAPWGWAEAEEVSGLDYMLILVRDT